MMKKVKKSMGFSFQPYTAEHSCWNIKKKSIIEQIYYSYDKLQNYLQQSTVVIR